MAAGGPRVLVIEGNVAALRARQREMLGYDTGEGYARTLQGLEPGLVADIVRPADSPVAFPAGVSLADYDGVAITGSALNIYDGGPAIERQVELAQAVFAAGVPMFGSCWGLQVAVTAAGGRVHRNPKGREFGFGRRIQLTDAGRAHPLFAGKPEVFEAPTVHLDAIESLPPGASELARNDMSLQAAAFSSQRGTFWGVQYHPEYAPRDIAAVADRYGRRLVDDGMFADEAALQSFAAELRQLDRAPADRALAWKHGLGPGITDTPTRLRELRNWLDHLVLPRAQRGG